MTRAFWVVTASLVFVGSMGCSSSSGRRRNNGGSQDMAGGGGGGGGGNKDMAGGGGGGGCESGTDTLQFVANSITVPSSASQFAYDIDGDGKADNKLGSVFSLFGATGANPQTAVDLAIQEDGTLLVLMETEADDFDFSDCGTVRVGMADTKPSPNLSGSGTFSLDGALSTLTGTIANGRIDTADPATATTPFQLTLRLPIIAGAAPSELPLTAAHLEGTINASANTVGGGEIHGAIKQKDMLEKVLPGVAAAMTTAMNDPSNSAGSTIKSLFDTGCDSGDGAANDDVIDVCEITESSFGSSFAPDLDLYSDTSIDSNGNVIGSYGTYDPQPTTASSLDNDCVSIGVAFTAVGASF